MRCRVPRVFHELSAVVDFSALDAMPSCVAHPIDARLFLVLFGAMGKDESDSRIDYYYIGLGLNAVGVGARNFPRSVILLCVWLLSIGGVSIGVGTRGEEGRRGKWSVEGLV